HMRFDVMGEIVRAVVLHRQVDGALGDRRVARLLVRERPNRLKAVVARSVRRPAGSEAIGLLEDRRGLTVAEPDRVADATGEQIRRVRVEDLPPDAKGQVERTPCPGRKRGDMLLLAVRYGRRTRLR